MSAQDQFGLPHDPDVVGLFNSKDYDAHGIGLALSGGGYKAAAFHLGSLIRLNELNLLKSIKRIASVSGGSIAAGFLGLNWHRLDFDGAGHARGFTDAFAEPLREFLTEVNLDFVSGVLGLLLPFRSGADGVAEGYARHLFGEATLQDLPDEAAGDPRFVILSTNYELNSLWRFSRPYAADYRVGMIERPTLKLARVVAGSSAFPPFFCPLTLDLTGQTWRQDVAGADRHEGRFLERALLADGGIYDNMGLEPIAKRYGTLLISNAGGGFDEEAAPENWFSLLLRVNGMIHRQAENNRVRELMLLAAAKARTLAYWPLRGQAHAFPDPSPARLPAEDVEAAQGEPVRLTSLGNKAFARLANQGYSLCDSAVRSYLNRTDVPARLPF